jgi:uncharacterized protein (DUF983 family)
MSKKSKLGAILNMKCPRCHEGNLYSAPITEGIYKMPKVCPHCKQNFEPEPGFYWGAMYVGYGLSASYMLSTVSIFLLGFNLSVNMSFVISILGGIFIFPFVARLSRSIWIHINVGYNEKYAGNLNNHKD